jgi:hypothetical protein
MMDLSEGRWKPEAVGQDDLSTDTVQTIVVWTMIQ